MDDEITAEMVGDIVNGPPFDWSKPVSGEAAPITRERLARVWYGEFNCRPENDQ